MAKSKQNKSKGSPAKKEATNPKSLQSPKASKKSFNFGGVKAVEVGAIAGLLMVPQRSVAGGPCY